MTEPIAIIEAMGPAFTDRHVADNFNEQEFFENLRMYKEPGTERDAAPNLNFDVKPKRDKRISVQRKLQAARQMLQNQDQTNRAYALDNT